MKCKIYITGKKCVQQLFITYFVLMKNRKNANLIPFQREINPNHLDFTLKIHKIVKNQNLEKLLKWCLDIDRPKDNIFKTLCSYAKNYVHEVKKSIQSSKKISKIALKLSKMQKSFFALSKL